MHATNEFLRNLALVLCVAGVTTVVFQRLRQPLVLGYLLAGLIIGPHVPIPLVADAAIVHGLSELGVILLMFSIGLEFTFGKLLRASASAGIVAVVQVSLMLWLGHLAARLFGWTPREALYTGAIVAISSTTIIAKAFDESKIGGRLRELVLAVLIVEDLIAVLLLAGLTTFSAGSLSVGALASTAGTLAAFLVGLVVAGLFVIPRLMKFVLKQGRSDVTVVASVGIAFALALLASRAGYSVALGAFLAGSLVAESGEGEKIEHLVQPVRDLFAAVFFVSVGMLIDPALVARNWLPVLVLTSVVIGGKIIGVSLPALAVGAGVRTSVRAGMSLAQIGEFSFIIAALGLSLGATGEHLYPVAVAVSALTTLTTPWLIGWSDGLASFVDRRLPHSIQTLIALYGAWIERLRGGGKGPRGSPVRRRFRLLLLDVAAVSGLLIAASWSFGAAVGWLATVTGLHRRPSEAAIFCAQAAVLLPFAAGIVRVAGQLGADLAAQAFPSAGEGKLDLSAAPRRALLLTLQLGVLLAAGLVVQAVTQPFLPPGLLLPALALAVLAVAVRLWRSAGDLEGHVRAGAQVVVDALAARALGTAALPARSEGGGGAELHANPADPDADDPISALLGGYGSPVRVRLPEGGAAVGQSLQRVNLRGRTGATVLAIARAEGVIVPTGQELLRVGDVLALAGAQEAVQAARELLET